MGRRAGANSKQTPQLPAHTGAGVGLTRMRETVSSGKDPRKSGGAGQAGNGAAGSAKRTFWGSMMKSARQYGDAHTIAIEAVTVEHITAEPVETSEPRWPIPPVRGEASLGARLSEILAQETPDDLLSRLAMFRKSVKSSRIRSALKKSIDRFVWRLIRRLT